MLFRYMVPIFFIAATVGVHAQVTPGQLSYFPIAPGNSWTYEVKKFNGGFLTAQYDTTMSIAFTDTVIALNGQRYWHSSWGPIRVDSLSGKVFIHPSYKWCTDSTEREFVNLSLDTANYYYMCNIGKNEFWDVQRSSQPLQIGQLPIERMTFNWTAWDESRSYADSIGLYYWEYWENNRVTWRLKEFFVYGQHFVPVTLTSLTSTLLPQGILLRWQTSEESDNMGFEVQRRIGDGGWEAVTFLPSNGNPSGGVYSWLDDVRSIDDHAPLRYRLRQIDYSGKDWLSHELVIERDGALHETPGLTIAPHPVQLTATIRVHGVDPGSGWTLQVTDLYGRIMHKREISQLTVGGELTVDVRQFSTGVYTVLLSNGMQTIWNNMVVRNN